MNIYKYLYFSSSGFFHQPKQKRADEIPSTIHRGTYLPCAARSWGVFPRHLICSTQILVGNVAEPFSNAAYISVALKATNYRIPRPSV